MESHLRVEIIARTGDEPGHLARINGVEFPVKAYAIEQDESGAPSLSLLLAIDSLSIGEPPAPTAPPQAPSAVSSWGDNLRPDPRESIPGWHPEKLSGQVAGHAERVALRTCEAAEGPEKASAFKRLVRLGPSAVTP